MGDPSLSIWKKLATLCWLAALLLTSCQPTPTGNVVDYLLAERLGRLHPAPANSPRGLLSGLVMGAAGPRAGATVVVAERTGKPYTGTTDQDGRYRIEGIPSGQYVPAAVAPGYAEQVDTNLLDMPDLVTIKAGQTTEAPLF